MSDSNQIDDGGPAFPLVSPHGLFTYRGLTMRDYFACQVLAGYASDHMLHEQYAHHAYKVADAMLAARSANQ